MSNEPTPMNRQERRMLKYRKKAYEAVRQQGTWTVAAQRQNFGKDTKKTASMGDNGGTA
ncbi:MAG TPA: hypothetical protein VK149_04190 [Sideroxyarcus sp.]|nr:hypothetical protein [Sideroxyarcus sp.]